MTIIDQIMREFEERWRRGDATAFIDMLGRVCLLVDNGRLSVVEAARCLVATMFIPGVDDDPLREEVLMVAGDLELANSHYPQHTWSYLLELKGELDQRAS